MDSETKKEIDRLTRLIADLNYRFENHQHLGIDRTAELPQKTFFDIILSANAGGERSIHTLDESQTDLRIRGCDGLETAGIGGGLILVGGIGASNGAGGSTELAGGEAGGGNNNGGDVQINGGGGTGSGGRGTVTIGVGDIATNATHGFLEIMSGNGPPTGTPVITVTNSIPIYIDRANDNLYMYRGSWKKTTTFT